MDSEWYYYDGGERRGPVPLADLLNALDALAEPHLVDVWRSGMMDWRPAHAVPEVAPHLPPGWVPPAPRRLGVFPLTGAEAMARLYRRLILLVGLQLFVCFALVSTSPWIAKAPDDAAGLVGCSVFLILLVLFVGIAVVTYKLAPHLVGGLPLAWAIFMFLPCVNIVGLLILSSKAQAWCKQYGIRVGLLGPSPESIEELSRRSLTSDFD